ncbi:MAG: hypothetical protein NTNFB01_21850 [Nitrospira sp.]
MEKLMVYIWRDLQDAWDATGESKHEDVKPPLEQRGEEARVETPMQWAQDRGPLPEAGRLPSVR